MTRTRWIQLLGTVLLASAVLCGCGDGNPQQALADQSPKQKPMTPEESKALSDHLNAMRKPGFKEEGAPDQSPKAKSAPKAVN